jgi:hypothetical protein
MSHMPDDPFDPWNLLNRGAGSGDPPVDAWQRLFRDGQMTLEALVGLDSFAATVRAIAALDEPHRMAALTLALVRFRRADGMTDAQYRDWLLRDFHTLGEE